MPKIHVLPKSVAELIAAGEVVERPSSAIKEIIENAVDAGSTKITVEIQNGGVRYMRVTDNGCGISREDVPNAFISHATSKVSAAEDLQSIFTLGFRGEALASIAAVAKVEMLTKTADEPFGTRYVIEGGAEVLSDDAGCPDGTTIVVRDLFYNTPARMKFLKKDMTEGNYVSDVVCKIALANPGISFRFIKDGKQVLFTPGDGKLLSAVSACLGKDFAASLIPCDYELNGVGVTGSVSLPRACRPTRNSQYFFVNSRYVRIPVGASALDEAYRNSIMVGKFPACVINLTIPPETVDVNVHPAKTEVRFSDDKRIFQAVYYAAKNAVSLLDVRPSLSLSRQNEICVPDSGTQIAIKEEPKAEKTAPVIPDIHTQTQPLPYAAEGQKSALMQSGPFAEKQREPESAPPQVVVYAPEDHAFAQARCPGYNPPEENESVQTGAESAPLPEQSLSQTGAAEQKALPYEMITADRESCDDEPKGAGRAPTPSFRYLGEAFTTYLIAESGDRLLLIDKHALHERILFEEIRAGGVCTSSQALLAPVSVHLDRREYAAVCENISAMQAIGFVLEDFGEGTLLVRECPMMFAGEDMGSVISELAGELLSHARELLTSKMDWLYHSAACRAAVKGGKSVTDEDACILIQKVLADDSLRYCPHGRPVLIELTRKELEKQFGRIP